MSRYESAIAERLHAAAGRIPVDTDPARVVGRRPTTVVRRGPHPRLLVAAGVGAVVAAAVAVAAVGLPSDAPTVEAGPGTARPDGPTGVAPPPAWFGEPQAGFRAGGRSGGRWVATAIGRVSDGAVSAPIVASAFDGTYVGLDEAVPVTIDGVPLRSARFGDMLVLATDGTPTVMVTGRDDERTLAAVLAAVEVVEPDGEFSLRLRSRPDGYAEIVPPRVFGPVVPEGETLASESGDTAIDQVSDVGDPLLAAAGSGADLTAVDVHGATGWFGRTTSEAHGVLTFLAWSPRPGVVFEVTTQDTERTEGDLADLARWVSTLDADDWDALHDD